MTMRFGLRVPTQGTPQETGAFAARVEAAGFDFSGCQIRHCWLAAGGMSTSISPARPCRQRVYALGPGVTNPLTRHPVATASAIISLDEASEGRADLVQVLAIARRTSLVARPQRCRPCARQRSCGGVFSRSADRTGWPGNPPSAAASTATHLSGSNRAQDAPAGRRNCRWGADHGGRCPGTVAWALAQIDLGMQRAGRQRHEATHCGRHCVCGGRQRPRHRTDAPLCGRLIPPSACGDFVASRPWQCHLPCRHTRVPTLICNTPWTGKRQRATAFVPDAAVDALVAAGSGAHIVARTRALMALDIDAIWWRDEGAIRVLRRCWRPWRMRSYHI